MRLRRGRKFEFDLAAHRAVLAEIEGRYRLARALHAEMARWPSPLRCWLLLQRGCPDPVPARADLAQRIARLDLEARGLPVWIGR